MVWSTIGLGTSQNCGEAIRLAPNRSRRRRDRHRLLLAGSSLAGTARSFDAGQIESDMDRYHGRVWSRATRWSRGRSCAAGGFADARQTSQTGGLIRDDYGRAVI